MNPKHHPYPVGYTINLAELDQKMARRRYLYTKVSSDELKAMPEHERREYTWLRDTDYWFKREVIDLPMEVDS